MPNYDRTIAVVYFEREVNRRIRVGWAAFRKLRLWPNKRQKSLASVVAVMAVMTYSAETSPPTMGFIRKLKITQRVMQKAILDHIRNDKMCSKTA